MLTFRVVENEADRCVVSIVGSVFNPVEVNGTEDVVFSGEWGGVNGKLRRCGWAGGSVVWG